MLLWEAEIQDTFQMLTLACNVFNLYLTVLLHFTDKPQTMQLIIFN